MWYAIGAGIGLLLFFAFRFYGKRVLVNHLFLTLYSACLEKTGSTETALRKGIENFTYRAPFNQLSESDIEHLINTFANHPDPKTLGLVLQNADRQGSVEPLRDRDFVINLANELAGIEDRA